MSFLFCLIFLSFLNAKDVEALRDHFLAMIERAQQGLRILNRDQTKHSAPPSRSEPIPEGAWKDHPASDKQLSILEKFKVQHSDGITKGEAADIIKGLFARKDT